MVYTDAGSYPNFLTGLFGSLGHTLKHTLVIVHTNGTVVGLCTGSRAVPAAEESVTELVAEKVVAMLATGKEVNSKGFTPMRPSCSGQIHLRTVHLVHTHSITDEINTYFA